MTTGPEMWARQVITASVTTDPTRSVDATVSVMIVP
jgi:hypothetical protein